jgi:hypothetical protein
VFSLSNQIGPVAAPALAGIALGYGVAVPYLYGLAIACLGIGALTLTLRRVIPDRAGFGAAGRTPEASRPARRTTT